MSEERPTGGVDQSEFLALVGDLRPELHRYCARLTVMDGEEPMAAAIMAVATTRRLPVRAVAEYGMRR